MICIIGDNFYEKKNIEKFLTKFAIYLRLFYYVESLIGIPRTRKKYILRSFQYIMYNCETKNLKYTFFSVRSGFKVPIKFYKAKQQFPACWIIFLHLIGGDFEPPSLSTRRTIIFVFLSFAMVYDCLQLMARISLLPVCRCLKWK